MINNHNYIPTIYVGYDPREDIAFKVLKYSVLKHASGPINIYPIKQEQMRRIGFYRRAWQLGSSSLPQPQKEEDIQHRDIFDKKPFPISENLYKNGFYLPSGLNLKLEIIKKISDAVKKLIQ